MGILDQFRLDGRTALVTGCKRGIGKALAIALADAGADVVGVSATLEPGSDVETEIKSLGRKYFAYQCDFSKRELLYQFINKVKSECPPIDILVNNAGTQWRKPVHEFPDEAWDHVMEVNLNAQFLLTREFGKEMIKRQWGKVIFIASVIAFQGGITIPAYAASKGGVVQLTRSFANEWASQGVNVNAIAPGYINTDINEALINDETRYPAILNRIPAGRWGEPEDFKGAVVFLASDACSYMNGSVVTVDGGWLSR